MLLENETKWKQERGWGDRLFLICQSVTAKIGWGAFQKVFEYSVSTFMFSRLISLWIFHKYLGDWESEECLQSFAMVFQPAGS